MKIIPSSDHAGFALKEAIKKFLESHNYEVLDMGPVTFFEDDDYPDYITPATQEVSKDPINSRGIFVGGSGQGEGIAANRVKGIRAAVYYGGNREILEVTRADNDSNVLSMGARFMTEEEALMAVKLWLETPFSGEDRHARRNSKIDK